MSNHKRQRQDKRAKSRAPPTHYPLFINAEAKMRYTSKLASKKVIYGRVLNDKSTFNENGLNLLKLIEFQGLINFLSFDMNISPSFVKQFYTNIHHPYDEVTNSIDNDNLASRVGNVNLKFDEQDLAVLFDIDYRGDQLDIYKLEDVIKDSDFDMLTAINIICRDRCNDLFHFVRGSHLKLTCRLIHLIVVNNLTHKTGSRDLISKFEVFLTWAIWTYKRLNWAGLIYNHFVKRGASRKDNNLGFGIALSKLFEKFEIDVDHEYNVHILNKDDYYTDITITKMGYKLFEGVWFKKGGEDHQEEQAELAQNTPVLPAPHTLADIMHEICDMRLDNRRRFDQIDSRQRAYEDAFHSVYPNYQFPPGTKLSDPF